jgi:ABC-2 type transport system permease protein
MSKATFAASAAGLAVEAMHRTRRGIDLSILATLFWLTLRQHVRGRRLVILAVLFLLPSVLVIVVRSAAPDANLTAMEFGILLNLIPYTLVPLTAVLYASGMIQDEMEEQTLTYLLIRPMPKWSIYLVKLLATLVVVVCLVGFFTMVTYTVTYWGTGDWGEAVMVRAPRTAALLALSLVGYCCLFGCVSLYTRRSLVAGVAYVIIFEGFLANFDFVFRRGTFMFYFRVLARRWLPLDWDFLTRREDLWSLNMPEAPSAAECVRTVLVASVLATVLAAVTFMSREFRVKTPEGN